MNDSKGNICSGVNCLRLNVGLGSGFFRVVLFFGGVFVVVFPEVFAVGFFVAVFLAVGFFAGVDEGFVALGVVFGLGFPGAVVFWRVEVVFVDLFTLFVDFFEAFTNFFSVELLTFAFGVVVGFFLGGIILQVHESQVVRGQEYDTVRDCFQH